MTTQSPSADSLTRWLRFVCPKGDRRVFANGEFHTFSGGRWQSESQVRATREAAERMARAQVLDGELLLSDGKRQERIRDATPDWAQLKREIPGLNVIEHEDGSKTADFRGDEAGKKKLAEMFNEAREMEIEKSEDLSSRVETATVGKGKLKREVPIAQAEKVDRKLHGAD